MHCYTPYLLEDIKAAEYVAELKEKVVFNFEGLQLELEQGWDTEYRCESTLGELIGLKKEDFPPVHQLSNEDLELICEVFEDMLFTWNASISLPEDLPLPLRYQFTLGVLAEDFIFDENGFITFDYCTGNSSNCPFGEYCECSSFGDDDWDDF